MGLGPVSAARPRPGTGRGPASARQAAGSGSALIPDSFLDQLKERSSVLDVVGRRVQLRKSGSVMVGLCPFHKEKSPSFTVSPVRNTYHCFGCGAHGDALSFLVEHDGLPFRQAVRELAGELGMVLPQELQASGKPAVDTAPMYEAMALAQRFFLHCLTHSPEARAYLRGRGLESRMLKRFNIGYAPAQWRGLREAFADYDRNTTIVEVGLVREKHQGEEHPGEKHQAQWLQAGASTGERLQVSRSQVNRYDTFRDRITFGVRDTRGRIVAFGGRLLGGGKPKDEARAEPSGPPGKDSGNEPGNQAKDGPKYLNSPESPIFDKSGSLFGLFEARESIRQHKRALVVEGFMDVVMLAQHGVENAVAAMGTAFTRWHLERLLTQTSNIAFCFDGDAAGQRAAFKAMETCAGLIEDEHDFRFVVLPATLDPDEFVRAHGAQAMQDLVQSAPGWTEFMLTSLQERHGIDPSKPGTASAQARAQFAAQAVGLVQRIAHGQRLRKIALEHIEAESRLPGAALQALRRAPPAVATRARSLWELLQNSAKAAPAVALSVREEIIGLLEPEHPQELALLQTLRHLQAPVVGGAHRAHGATHAAASATDNTRDAGYLMACDSLKNAVDLIVEHRQRQVREELDRQLAAGQITDLEYLRAKQTLMDEAGAS